MTGDDQILLGSILIELGYTSPDAVIKCIRTQEKSNVAEPLGEIMIRDGIISQRQLAKALDTQARRLTVTDPLSRHKKEDAVFGRIGVAKKIITRIQLHKAIRVQAKLAYLGHFKRIGGVMVDLGFITLRQVARLLEYQKKKILMCPECFLQFNVSRYITGYSFKCTRCAHELTVPNKADSVQVAYLEQKPEAPFPPQSDAPEPPEDKEAMLAEEDDEVPDVLEIAFLEDDLIGKTLGGCRLDSVVGRGGMGTVFKGLQTYLDRTVAVKVLAREHTSDSYFVQRFMSEAKAVAKLSHANIVPVYKYGRERGHYYIVMQFIKGEELLDRLLRTGPMTPREALDIAAGVASALAAAAKRHIIHRDIKPENIILAEDGRPMVTDFGIAKNLTDDLSLTRGRVVGTPAYMSPEQVRGLAADVRSDIYSLGATLYAMLAGRPPFIADNYVAVMHMHANSTPEPIGTFRPNLPAPVERMVMKMLEKKPGKRYQAHEEVIEAIEEAKLLAADTLDSSTVDEVAAAPLPQKSGSSTAIVAAIILFLIILGALTAYFYLYWHA